MARCLHSHQSNIPSDTMQHYLLLHLLLAATADVSFHLNDLSHTHPRIVHPRLHETHRWHHKKITRNLRYLTKETLQIVELGPITLELTPEGSLIVEDDLSSAWIGEKGQERQRETAKCDHRRGVVRGARLSSTVGLSLCGHELTGYIGLGERVYLVEPLGANVSGDNPHVLVEGEFWGNRFGTGEGSIWGFRRNTVAPTQSVGARSRC